ncbi:MAG TPA: DUF1501 domain-containing protein [Acidiferrobacterales bacterium]|nr:DUF1501 domain-containing protein [Acidiferrobacterales bacterium]
MNRRLFLKRLTALSAVSLIPIGRLGWAAKTTEAANNKRLIVVFLRGAVDGLNVVIPYNERNYYLARPGIAIPPPASGAGGALDLDGRFGLHPALAPVLSLWRDRSLAFVHACGSPDPTRSHFDAQDYMESGTPGIKSTADGWMNRLLAVLPGGHSSTSALNLGPTAPRILQGPIAVANLPLTKNAAQPMPLDRPPIGNAFDRLYAGNDPLSLAYKEGQAMRKKLLEELKQDMQSADNGAPSANGFAAEADRLARLLVRDAGIRLVFIALGGWDTHINQGAANGQLANHLRPLSEGLITLAQRLGPAYADTVIIVLSEFGRTVNENGNGGTDHGHGNVLWVLGGPIHGGKVYGQWPGLSPENLYEARDLAVTTDFREAIGVVAKRHLNVDDKNLARLFPNSIQKTVKLGGLIS